MAFLFMINNYFYEKSINVYIYCMLKFLLNNIYLGFLESADMDLLMYK